MAGLERAVVRTSRFLAALGMTRHRRSRDDKPQEFFQQPGRRATRSEEFALLVLNEKEQMLRCPPFDRDQGDGAKSKPQVDRPPIRRAGAEHALVSAAISESANGKATR
jgi:hypothetical protein